MLSQRGSGSWTKSPSHSQEKGNFALQQSCPASSSDLEHGLCASQKNINDTSENVNDPSKNDKNHGWLPWIVFPGFVGWWFRGAIVLVVLLALSGTALRTAHMGNVRLLGFFFWLAISWCSLLFSYITSWALGYFWFRLCQEDRLNFDDYQNFVVDIRHSIMLFLWAIISWALVPLLCVLDHRHCTDHWVSVLHEVLLVTFIFAIGFLVKSFFVERLFIKVAMEYGSWKQRELEKSFYAIVTLLPEPHPCQSIREWIKDIGTWMEDMRTWSTTPKRTKPNIYTLEEEDDLDQAKSSPPSPEDPAQYPKYVADIFRGNGTKNVYEGLLSAIRSNRAIQCKSKPEIRCKSKPAIQCKSNLAIQCKCLDGLCNTHIDQYLQGRHKGLFKCNKDYSLALKQFKDKDSGDTLWSRLKHKNGKFKDGGIDTMFSKLKPKEGEINHDIDHDIDKLWSNLKDKEGEITFKELYWQIQYLGESLREVVEGQKNLKRVIRSLHVRASLFLCIPVAVIYSTFLPLLSNTPPQFS